jgi:hypothetical protein
VYFKIGVNGHLDSRWSAWFDVLQITTNDRGHTSITGPVTHQAAAPDGTPRVREPQPSRVATPGCHRRRTMIQQPKRDRCTTRPCTG